MATITPLLLHLLILLFLSTPTLSIRPPSTPVTPDVACSATLYPSFCRSILPPNASQPLTTYTCLSTSRSLATSAAYIPLLSDFLRKNHPSLSPSAIFALQDCQLLADLTLDFLSVSNATITEGSLSNTETEEIHTLLSSALTNLQTCVDGLYVVNDTTINNNLYNRLANGTTLYSIALDLFAKTWTSASASNSNPRTTSRRLLVHEGKLAFEMSRAADRELFERRSGHRLLQAPSGPVVSEVVVVSQDGSGNFTTITDAVNSGPNNTDGSGGYYLIYVTKGVYKEYVSIDKKKKHVMIVGDGINRTVVTGNRSVANGWTTFNSATFAVVAQGFVAINMTFQNTAGAAKHQAVALRSGADLSAFYLCSFEGYQDTLYTHSMRQFYRECHIYGTVDFIFGNAAVVFQNCNIHPRLPMPGQSDPITAQGRTDPNQNTGISIHNCTITPAENLGMTKTYLGRPWKKYSRTVVMQSFIGSLVDPAGWLAWNGDFALSTLYYAEYKNTGPGSDTSNRITWPGYHPAINSTDAIDFTVNDFLLGDFWLPQTGVPYFSGLL